MSGRTKRALPPKSSPVNDVGSVLDALRRIVRVLRLGSREAEKSVGLSAAQLFVLQKLAEQRILSVNEVAERTHTHQSSVSVVVQRLVDRGFVSRKRSKQDARQVQLSVTPAGRMIVRSAPKATQDRLIAALEQLSPRHLRDLAISLKRILDLLGIDRGKPATMLFEEESESSPRRKSKSETTKVRSKG